MEVKLIISNRRRCEFGFTGVLFMEEGKTTQLKGLVRDIDHHKMIEEKLRTSQEIMHSLIEAVGIGMWNWDVKSRPA